MLHYYDIDGNGIGRSLEDYSLAWASDDRQVGDDEIGEARVSTVHLVLNHQWNQGGAPLIFETMIFGGEYNEWQCRWATKQNALAGHKATIAWILSEGPEPEGDYEMTYAEWEADRSGASQGTSSAG